MSRTCLAVSRLLALAFALGLCLPLGADDTGHVATALDLADPEIRLPLAGDALVRRTATMALQAGPNLLAFPFGRLDMTLDALELEVVSPAEGVTITDTFITPDARDTVQWVLSAREPCEVTIVVAHPLKGIEWRVEYTATMHREAEALSIGADIVLTNKSKLEFPAARLEMPTGGRVSTALRQNDTFQLPVFIADAVLYRSLFVYDPARFGGTVTAVLRVLRDRDDPFSTGPLPAGKVRIYAPGQPAAYVGEDALPYLPPRESVDLKLGAVPDVTVARKILKSSQVEVRSDVRNKLVLFHQDDEVEFEVKNLRRAPLVLHVRDRIEGDWTILRHSLPFERIDAATVEFVVPLGAGETRKLGYTARRHNLQP